jgi:hypothetical protein
MLEKARASVRVAKQAGSTAPPELETQLAELRMAIAQLQPGRVAATVVQCGGAVGARHYVDGQLLIVRVDVLGNDGVKHSEWREAEVEAEEAGGKHRLKDGVSLVLHPWNHAPREVPQRDFDDLRTRHMAGLQRRRKARECTPDPGAANRIRVQRIDIHLAVPENEPRKLESVTNACRLCEWLHMQHTERLDGGVAEGPVAVLVTGSAGAGKTTLLTEVELLLPSGSELVPILVKVQRLQRLLKSDITTFAKAWNWVDAYLRLCTKRTPTYIGCCDRP